MNTSSHECLSTQELMALVSGEPVADVQAGTLEHIARCSHCAGFFDDYHRAEMAVALLRPSDFVCWDSASLCDGRALVMLRAPDDKIRFEVFSTPSDVEYLLEDRYPEKVVVRDPTMYEVGLTELVNGAGDRSRRDWRTLSNHLARLSGIEGPKESRLVQHFGTSPFVSVIIPTYNRAEVLPRAIRSALEQTYEHYEVIVIDDGSTDDTVSALAAFTNCKIRLCRLRENSGPAAARNLGLKHARGELVAFLDSDDEWYQHYLLRMVGVISASADIVAGAYCSVRRVDRSGTVGQRPAPRVKRGRVIDDGRGYAGEGIHMSATVLRRDCLLPGGFDSRFRVWEDVELITRLIRKYSLVHVGEPLVRKYESARMDITQPLRKKTIEEMKSRFKADLLRLPLPNDYDGEARIEAHLSGDTA